MLKLTYMIAFNSTSITAAFRRLCVETIGRIGPAEVERQPPSGGCVLKHNPHHLYNLRATSRLQAAVC